MTGRGGRRLVALAATLLATAAASCACDETTPTRGPGGPPPASSPPASSPPPSTGAATATALHSTVGCRGEPPRARVVLRWSPSGAGPQRVDVSVLDEGFAAGTFATSRTLRDDRAVLRWPAPRGEATHFWRVRTGVGGRWVTSATATFVGPGCVGVDLQPGDPSDPGTGSPSGSIGAGYEVSVPLNQEFRVEDIYPGTGALNEVIPANATQRGDVLFEIPETTREGVLTMRFDGDKTRTVPFRLEPPA